MEFQESTNESLDSHDRSLKNFEATIGRLSDELHKRQVIRNKSVGTCMSLVTKDDIEDSGDNFHYAPFDDSDNAKQPEGAPIRLPNKEDSAESFALPCLIGKHSLTVLADLGSSINVMPLSLFRSLNITCLEKTNLVIEMANMTRATPVGVVNNVIVKIDRFLFPVDFVVVDMANTPNEDLILGRPFLATARARIDVL